MGNKYVEVKNKSAYPPSAGNIKGEVHEEKAQFAGTQGVELRHII